MKPSASRTGFSLLEVLMATSILLGSVIVLGQLADIGRKDAASAEDRAMAQALCSARLNDMLASIEPIEEIDDQEIEERPGWIYSVTVDPVADWPGLIALSVSVSREETEPGSPSHFTLVRWVADPERSPSTTPFVGGVLSQSDFLPGGLAP